MRGSGQAAEHFGHAMFATGDHGGGEMVRTGDDIGDDFGFGGIRHGGFKDTDDAAIRMHRGGPETIGQDGDARSVRSIVGGTDETTEDRAKAHYVEIIAV